MGQWIDTSKLKAKRQNEFIIDPFKSLPIHNSQLSDIVMSSPSKSPKKESDKTLF